MKIGIFRYRSWLPVFVGIQLLLVPPLFGAEKKLGPGDAALVNGKSISILELEKGVDGIIKQLASTGRNPDVAQLGNIKKGVLEDLINIELLSQEVGRKGIKIENSVVSDKLKSIKASFPDEKAFKDALSKDQISESDLKSKVERRLQIEELLSREVVQKVVIPPEEGKSFYDSHPEAFKQPETVHACHILIKVDPKASDSDKKKARKSLEDIQDKLKKGEDFAALAKQYSQCPSNVKGGDLGFLARGETVKAFEDTAFSLKPGETSGIVETEFGFHIIRVLEKKAEGTVSYAEAQDAVQKHLKDQKIKMEMARYIDGLKANAKVERNLQETGK